MKMVRTAVAAVCIMSSCVEAGNTFSHLFGGNEDDVAYAVTKADDGYIVAGKSESFSNHRDSDAYVVKIDLQGEKLWSKVYGGRDDDVANDITTVGSDAVFVGTSESYGSERNAIYMSRLGTMGKPRWNTIYFYDENDEYFGTAVCHKGEMLFFAGYDRHLGFFDEERDIYLCETNRDGDMQWLSRIATKDEESVYDMACTSDGFVIAGASNNFGDDDGDMYLAKLDAQGKHIWQIAFGGTDKERANAVVETPRRLYCGRQYRELWTQLQRYLCGQNRQRGQIPLATSLWWQQRR